MDSIRDRLLQCFRTLFPGQPDAVLLAASPDTIARWDSTSHFLLLSAVEEEFELRIPESTGGELLSFDEFESYLDGRLLSA